MELESTTLDRKSLVALVDASRAVVSELEPAAVFERVAEHAATVLRAEGSSVLLFDAPRNELVFQVATGPAADVLSGERFSAQLGIAGQALKTGRALRVDDARNNRNFFPGIDAKTHVRTHGIMAAPMMNKGETIGVVEVINPLDRERFTQHDLELLELFANMVGPVAANVQAYEALSRRARGLSEQRPRQQLVGRSSPIRQVIELCGKVAISDATVLLCGETGTGKELAAHTIHNCSPRHDRAFIAINCAALPESLLESELFGHEKGAFTGASGRKLGRFELADGGTLFLDEIGELSPAIQVKLLRVIQEREFVRVGGTQAVTCDVRIVTATNRDLRVELQSGRFREDLFYRLNVFPITLPPLRDRMDDLPELARHFLELTRRGSDAAPKLTDAALDCLMAYRWPGNVRELRNVIERCALLAGPDGITPATLPPEIGVWKQETSTHDPHDRDVQSAGSRLANHERAMVLRALEDCAWNQSKAARALGIGRDQLRYRMKKYALQRPVD